MLLKLLISSSTLGTTAAKISKIHSWQAYSSNYFLCKIALQMLDNTGVSAESKKINV